MSDARYKRWLTAIIVTGVVVILTALLIAAGQYIGSDTPKTVINERLNAMITMTIFLTFIAGATLMFTHDLLKRFR